MKRGEIKRYISEICMRPHYGGRCEASTGVALIDPKKPPHSQAIVGISMSGLRSLDGGVSLTLRLDEAKALGVWLCQRYYQAKIYTALPRPIRRVWQKVQGWRRDREDEAYYQSGEWKDDLGLD